MPEPDLATKIRWKYLVFLRDMKDIWKEYTLLGFYLPLIHQDVKSGDLPPLSMRGFSSPSTITCSQGNTFGYISHLHDVGRVRSVLLMGVARFEYYHSDLCTLIYSEFPGKIAVKEAQESPDRQVKIIDMVTESADRAEILSKLIEEKVRSIFYGNPTDFFVKDKGKLGFWRSFADNCKNAMRQLAEVLARRNIYAHNNRRVDRKYLREVENPQFALGQIAVCDEQYLLSAFDLLTGISAMSACLVLSHICKTSASRRMNRHYARFLEKG